VAIKEEVKIVIDATGEGAQRAFNKVGGAMHGLGGKVKAAAKMMGVAMVAAGAAIGAATIKALNETKDYAVEVDKAAKTTGVAAEEFQKLSYAALQEHADMATLEKGLTKLAKNMGEAKDGVATYKDEFDRMGISVTDATGELKGTDDVLLEMADYFSTSTDETQKQAIAMTVLGKSGAELIPFLEMGREEIERLGKEAEKMGIVLSQDNVAQFKAYQDSIDRMKSSFKGLQMQAATAVVPAFQSITDSVTDMFVSLRESGTIETIFTEIGGVIEELMPTIETLLSVVGEVLEAFGPVVSELLGGLAELFADLVGIIVESGMIDTLSEIVGIIGETMIGAIEDLLPLIEMIAEGFAIVLEIVKPILEGVGILIEGITTVIGDAVHAVFGFGDSTNTTMEEVEEIIKNVEDAWGDLTRAEQEATLKSMETNADRMEALGWNQEAVDTLRAKIEELKGTYEADMSALSDWSEEYEGVMNGAHLVTEENLANVTDDWASYGAKMVKEGKDVPLKVIEAWANSNGPLAGAMDTLMTGALNEFQEFTGLTDEETQGMLGQLRYHIGVFGGDITQIGSDTYAEIDRTMGLAEGTTEKAMGAISGYLAIDAGTIADTTFGDYKTRALAQLQQLVDSGLYTFGQLVSEMSKSIAVSWHWGEGPPPGQHTGGLIKHTGGLVEAAHSGLLVSKRKSNERMILTEVDEYITKRQAVNHYERKYGPGFFDSINDMRYNPDQRQQHISVYQEIHNDVDLDRALSQLAMRLL